MKKGFYNILQKNKRFKIKVFACLLAMIVVLGMITACSTEEKKIDNNSLSEISEIMPEDENSTNSILEEQDAASDNEVEELQSKQEEMEQEPSDAQEIEDIVLGFAEGYFAGDIDLMKQFLIEPYEWDVDVYSGKEEQEVSIVEVSGIEETEDKAIDDVHVVSLVYKENVTDDSNKSLTIELVKTSQGWKIQFYGIEG